MRIVDAQVHIWGANTPERPWANRGKVQKPNPVGKDDVLAEMRAAGVDRVIIVPPSWEGDRNDLALAAAGQHPDRFAVMGRIDAADPKNRGVLAGWRKQSGMLGLRMTFTQPELKPQLTNGAVDWVWAEAERAGVPIYVLINHYMAPEIDAIAARHPGLKLIMDHLGIATEGRDDGAFAEFDKFLALAKRPNVAVKTSALPCYSTEAYPFPKLHKYLRRVYDAFGPQRMFWGSDLTRLPCSYRQCVTMFTEELPWLSGKELEQVMGRGVCEWTGWSW